MEWDKRGVISKYRTHETDTGSAEVQIALLSERINQLGEHFKLYKKDHQSRRGLLKLVGHRKRLLTYLKETSQGRYERVTKGLGLRK